MNKADSLRKLHEWAEQVRMNAPHPYGYPTSPADETRVKGLQAVEFVRQGNGILARDFARSAVRKARCAVNLYGSL
jgi:hypothetical protein